MVRYVNDGDTVTLEDGRRVRLIGVNAPEISRDGSPSEPYARASRRALSELLGSAGDRVRGRYGNERRDRYGRTLAHLYLPDGNNLAALMLGRGMSTAVVVPPNDRNSECYFQVESTARERGTGIWSHPRYRPVDSRRLSRSADGFRVVTGRVERVGAGRTAIWLNLPGNFALKIDRDDLGSFAGLDPLALEGREVVARGWIYRRDGQLRVTIRHPANLEVLSP